MKSVLLGGRAASSGAPLGTKMPLEQPVWLTGVFTPTPETETQLVSQPQHTLGRKTTVSGDTLLLADVPKIILKGTFNEINLFSLCFGFQGLFPR